MLFLVSNEETFKFLCTSHRCRLVTLFQLRLWGPAACALFRNTRLHRRQTSDVELFLIQLHLGQRDGSEETRLLWSHCSGGDQWVCEYQLVLTSMAECSERSYSFLNSFLMSSRSISERLTMILFRVDSSVPPPWTTDKQSSVTSNRTWPECCWVCFFYFDVKLNHKNKKRHISPSCSYADVLQRRLGRSSHISLEK